MYFKQGYNVDTNIVYLSKFTWRRYIELLQLAPSAIQVKVQTHGIWSNGGDNTCKTESNIQVHLHGHGYPCNMKI